MRGYSIVDLLIDQYYAPTSMKRRFNGGIINHAEKRDDVWVGDDYKAFAVRYKPERGINYAWATIAVKVAD